MDNRKELKHAYRNTPKTAGVFQIRNTQSGKVFFGSSMNLHGLLARHEFELALGSHRIVALQDDWKRDGADAFVFEVLETLPVNDDPAYDYSTDLEILEFLWMDTLEPFGENVYNSNRRVRQA